MQKPASSIRISFSSLFTGLLLVLVLIVLISSSTGSIRGGDDEGSGIGGTGRSLLPGGSGLGGTGLKPFVSMNDNQEVEVLINPAQQESSVAASIDFANEPRQTIDWQPVESAIAVTADHQLTTDSSAISVTEQIQHEVDINAVAFAQLDDSLASVKEFEVSGTDWESRDYSVSADRESTNTVLSIEGDAIAAEQNQLTWDMVSNYLSRNAADLVSADSSDGFVSADEQDTELAAKPARPERIQRPQLPPVQRVRPIQRASILPPRIKPLRL